MNYEYIVIILTLITFILSISAIIVSTTRTSVYSKQLLVRDKPKNIQYLDKSNQIESSKTLKRIHYFDTNEEDNKNREEILKIDFSRTKLDFSNIYDGTIETYEKMDENLKQGVVPPCEECDMKKYENLKLPYEIDNIKSKLYADPLVQCPGIPNAVSLPCGPSIAGPTDPLVFILNDKCTAIWEMRTGSDITKSFAFITGDGSDLFSYGNYIIFNSNAVADITINIAGVTGSRLRFLGPSISVNTSFLLTPKDFVMVNYYPPI